MYWLPNLPRLLIILLDNGWGFVRTDIDLTIPMIDLFITTLGADVIMRPVNQ